MTYILGLLAIVSVVYTLGVVCYFERKKREVDKKVSGEKNIFPSFSKKKNNIIGKGTFVLMDRKTQPNKAKGSEIEKDIKKEDTFAESKVSAHSRQIPPDELDEAFGKTPDGENNTPMEIEVPLSSNNSFPGNEETDKPDTEDDEDEDLPLNVRQGKRTVRTFEEMGEAYRVVVHNPQLTENEKRDTGRILLDLKVTDMFEALISGQKERENKVSHLIDSYLSAFNKKMQDTSGESPTPQGVPSYFDIRDYI